MSRIWSKIELLKKKYLYYLFLFIVFTTKKILILFTLKSCTSEYVVILFGSVYICIRKFM